MLTSDLFGNNQTQYKQSVAEGLMGDSDSPVAQAIIRRILMQRTDLLAKYGPSYVGQAVDDVADSVGDWDEIGSSDVSGWVRQVEHNLKNKLNQYDEPMNVGDALDEQAATEGEKSPMAKDAQRADRIRSLKNLIAIAQEQGRQLRVQELELELKKLQGVTEMDKSSPQPGRDGRVSHSTYGSRDKGGSKGTEREARPITAKKAAQHALDILKKQGVAEGLSGTQKKIEDTILKLEQRLKFAKTPEQWDNIKNRIERLQAGLDRSKQGVAEGVGNIGSAIKSLYQKIYRAGDDEIEYFYNASPIFAQYWDEYEGDLDSIIAEVDPEELAVIKAELESYAEDANLAEDQINEFAPPGGEGGPSEDEILFRLAKQWWLGTEQDMIRAERTLASMGWEIGEDEGYDDGGVFVVRAGDVNGKSYQSWSHEELEGLSESYPKHQDLSGISAEKLKAYLAKQAKQSVPGEGAQVKRVKSELQRREQGMAEGSQVTEISDRGLQNYRRQAHYAIQGHKFGSMKDAPNAAAIIAKREKGMQQASDKIVARKKAEDDKRLAVLVAKLPELKAEYEQMQAKYKSLGGSNWQYADREQNLSASEREARSMEGPMNNLWRQIQAAEKAQGTVEEGVMETASTNAAQSLRDFATIARNRSSLTYYGLEEAGHADKVLNAIKACSAFYNYFKNNNNIVSAVTIDNLRSDLIAFKNGDVSTLSELIKRGTLDKINLQEQGVAEGAEIEATLAKIAAAGDAGYEMIYDGLNGLLGGEVQIILQDMYDDVSRENRLHPDDDYDQIIDGMMDHIESDYGLAEEWSEKYKRSIDCSNPQGFSQKAHCAGRNKNESEELTEQDLEEAVGTLELADFLFKGLEQKFPKIIQRYGHEVVGNAIMDVAEENRDVSSVGEVDMLIDDIIEKLQNYNSGGADLSEAKVSRLYYNVVGTSERELRKEFGMRHDRRGWFLSESSGRNRIMDAQRAFGSPKLIEYDLAAGNGSAATLGPDNVISPIGTVPKGQRINTKKSRK